MPARRSLRLLLAAAAAATLGACAPEGPGEYVRVGGGGFLFNYRIAEATAGVVAERVRTMGAGWTVEAAFEDPAGGEPIVIVKPVTAERQRFSFSTPPLSGIEAGRDYVVTVRVVDEKGEALQTVEYRLRSEVDQALLPDRPLTIGPGYTRNPETVSPDDPG